MPTTEHTQQLPNPREFARREIDAGRARSATGVANQASALANHLNKRGERTQDWIQNAIDEAMRYLADDNGVFRIV